MDSIADIVNAPQLLEPVLRYQVSINKAQFKANSGGSVSANNFEKDTCLSLSPTEKPKRARTSFTNHQYKGLEREYKIDPYCSRARRYAISIQLNLKEKQVKAWFQNRRVRSRKEAVAGSAAHATIRSVPRANKSKKENGQGSSLDSTSSYEQGNSGRASSSSFPAYPHFEPVSPVTVNLYPAQNNSNGQHASYAINEQQWEMPAPVQNFQTQYSANWNHYNDMTYGTVAKPGYNYQQVFGFKHENNYQQEYQHQNYLEEYDYQYRCCYQQGSCYHQGYNGSASTGGYTPPNNVSQQPRHIYS